MPPLPRRGTNHSDLELRIRFPPATANLAGIRTLVEALFSSPAACGFHREVIDEILIAIQETLSNICRHADPLGLLQEIDLHCHLIDDLFRARIEHRGEAFHPEQIPEPDPAEPRDRGYGLFLVRQTMDRVSFLRQGERNVIILERSAVREPQAQPAARP